MRTAATSSTTAITTASSRVGRCCPTTARNGPAARCWWSCATVPPWTPCWRASPMSGQGCTPTSRSTTGSSAGGPRRPSSPTRVGVLPAPPTAALSAGGGSAGQAGLLQGGEQAVHRPVDAVPVGQGRQPLPVGRVRVARLVGDAGGDRDHPAHRLEVAGALLEGAGRPLRRPGQPRGGLLPHPRHAGQAVGGVAAEDGQVDVAGGRHAALGGDGRLVETGQRRGPLERE